jgi:hypothetical protein
MANAAEDGPSWHELHHHDQQLLLRVMDHLVQQACQHYMILLSSHKSLRRCMGSSCQRTWLDRQSGDLHSHH